MSKLSAADKGNSTLLFSCYLIKSFYNQFLLQIPPNKKKNSLGLATLEDF
uniref:Uncharacterized protein n=1 Tax=Solanum lycopersicum TaxID=4081 RepID=A0A3Q7FNE7_SOLLC